MLGRSKKKVAYYRSSVPKRFWWAVKHPVKTFRNIRRYGFWLYVVEVLIQGALLPPPLEEWGMAKVWKRKHTSSEATEIISVN